MLKTGPAAALGPMAGTERMPGTAITVTPDADKFPRPEYSVRIDWTCDPSRTATLVQRVFDEIAFIKATPLSPAQLTVIREAAYAAVKAQRNVLMMVAPRIR